MRKAITCTFVSKETRQASFRKKIHFIWARTQRVLPQPFSLGQKVQKIYNLKRETMY